MPLAILLIAMNSSQELQGKRIGARKSPLFKSREVYHDSTSIVSLSEISAAPSSSRADQCLQYLLHDIHNLIRFFVAQRYRRNRRV